METSTPVEQKKFGLLKDQTPITSYTLKNKKGTTISILNYGLTIQQLLLPDAEGKIGDIVLGFDNISGYEGNHPYIGCIVGRNANRIKNGRVVINGESVQLAINDGKNQLHGGPIGFHKKVWNCTILENKQGQQLLSCTHLSLDGEHGFPGNVMSTVTFLLTEENTLDMTYTATTDKTTVVNLTRHDYFNLNNGGASPIFDHELQINAAHITEKDAEGIPTGELIPVSNTSYDFNSPTVIQKNLDKKQPELLPTAYDDNYALQNKKGEMIFAASLHDPESERTLEIYTTQPGIQFYTGVHTKDQKGKNNTIYNPYSGLCLETQHFPDAPNHPNFETTLLNPGETYTHQLQYRFGIKV